MVAVCNRYNWRTGGPELAGLVGPLEDLVTLADGQWPNRRGLVYRPREEVEALFRPDPADRMTVAAA